MPCRGLRAFFGRVTAQFMAPPGVHGAKEGAEGLRGDERGGKKTLIAASVSLRPSVWERELAEKRSAGSSRVPKGTIAGSRASEKTRCRDTEGDSFPVLDALSPLLGDFLACTPAL
jgi:hypothetical protein